MLTDEAGALIRLDGVGRLKLCSFRDSAYTIGMECFGLVNLQKKAHDDTIHSVPRLLHDPHLPMLALVHLHMMHSFCPLLPPLMYFKPVL